jgi:hypothetical protein
MGYTTEFTGQLTIVPQLQTEQIQYLQTFNKTRRMMRDTEKLENVPDSIRNAVNLPLGMQGAYFVGYPNNYGQDRSLDVLDYNNPPTTQPGLWCKWTVTDDGHFLEWDEREKFYDYIEWLQYLIDNFFKKWNYVLNGTITWEGEDNSDMGRIVVIDNEIQIYKAKVIYELAS